MIWPQQRKRQERRTTCITSVQTITATNDVFLQRVAITRSTLTALRNFPPIALVNSQRTDSHVSVGHHVGTFFAKAWSEWCFARSVTTAEKFKSLPLSSTQVLPQDLMHSSLAVLPASVLVIEQTVARFVCQIPRSRWFA